MVIVKTVEEFHLQNEHELRNFMMFKTGIRDKDMIDDTIQEFYVRLIKSKVLEKFDESEATYGSTQTLFETWICNMFCWLLPVMKKRNFRDRFDVISSVLVERGGVKDFVDIWESLGKSSSYTTDFSVDTEYHTDQVGLTGITEYEHDVASLIRYIESTEEQQKAQQLVSYIQYKIEGLNGVDIAGLLKVSNAMVSTIKNNLYVKMREWKENVLELK